MAKTLLSKQSLEIPANLFVLFILALLIFLIGSYSR